MLDQQQQMLNSLSSIVVYKCQSHLEMSPFLCSGSWLFFFPVRAFCFYRKIFAPGCSRNDDSCHPRPTASPVLLAWSGAQPCGARRAKRLGRSGGLGQQRARYCGRQLGGSLLRLAAGRLMPRMVCRRRPLPFLDVWLANCYFADDSSGFRALLPFYDASSEASLLDSERDAGLL